MLEKLTYKKVFVVEAIAFALIISGVLPRSAVLYLVVALVLYALYDSLDEVVLLFVQSIPLFMAIPFTPTFDNFNTWRILSVIIFIRWFFAYGIDWLRSEDFKMMWRRHFQWHLKHPVVTALIWLLFLAFLSLIHAPSLTAGIKRIIYFTNLSLVGIVIWDLVRRSLLDSRRLIKSISIAVVLVIVVGYIQVISTYLIDVYQFMRLWGENIQLRQFGSMWSYIAVNVGNTWLAYYGDQLSLRVFSLFPDSHSFPVFVLLGIPTLFALALDKIAGSDALNSLKQLIFTRSRLSIVWVPLALLIAILSGTRGIWAASISTVLLALIVIWYNQRRLDVPRRNLFKYISLYLVLFFLLFSVAYPIFVSPQFLVSKGNWGLFGERIKSIIDLGETSNALRLKIWKESIVSIARNPILGVGIGNFPVVLGQDLKLARAGSSAHNLYLHVAAEMGIPALLIAIWFFWQLFAKIYRNFTKENDPVLMAYWAALLLYYPWVMSYVMTDPVLFDERAFLLFATTVGLAFSHE